MKNPFSDGSRKWKGLSLATTLIALSAVVLAWNITWNAPVSLTINSIDLKAYWEQNCTTPVATIDFGNLVASGASYEKIIYVKNEGLGPVMIRWNSTRGVVTAKITDYWEYEHYRDYGIHWDPINGTTIYNAQVLKTRYRINVQVNVDPGSYSWTLYLGAEQ